jgi:23S rRNA pseudouridine1911/1915/1917 synthase
VNTKVLEAVVPGEAPARLDVFLAGQFPEFSRSRIQQLIHAGLVSVDGHPAEKSGQTIIAGQQIRMEIPPPVTPAELGEKIDLQVIFEDENVLVIDKPAGMVVHPSYGHGSGTLVNAVLGREGKPPQINGEFRPGIVHRLDKETSGLILIAKNDRTLQFLQDQFKKRQVEKIYQTLVDGCPPTPLGRVEAHIGRDPKNRKKMAVTDPASGREAITEYRTLESFKRHTYLEIHPLTGRTHQIRVHMKFLGCPVTGDTVYGYKNPTIILHRHFLHAARLKIRLPGEDAPRVFITPLPVELQRTLDDLR